MEINKLSEKETQTRQRVNKIHAMLQLLHEELQLIQNDCLHLHTHVSNYSWRPGRVELYNICEICNKPIEPIKP